MRRNSSTRLAHEQQLADTHLEMVRSLERVQDDVRRTSDRRLAQERRQLALNAALALHEPGAPAGAVLSDAQQIAVWLLTGTPPAEFEKKNPSDTPVVDEDRDQMREALATS